jgi:hypothetical protein
MSISVVCPKCSAKLTAPDSAAGKKVKCPKCQTTTPVPRLLPEEPAFEVVDEPQPAEPPPPKPSVKAKAKEDVFLADDRREDEKPKKPVKPSKSNDDDDEKPKKKKKKKKGSGTWLEKRVRHYVGGGVLCVLLGIAGWVFSDRSAPGDDVADSGDTTKETNPPDGKSGKRGRPGSKQSGTANTLTSPAGFRVTFPGPYEAQDLPPDEQAKLGVPLTTHIAVDPNDAHIFLASSAEFPANATAAERKQIVERIVRTVIEEDGEATVNSRKPVKVGGQNWEELKTREAGGGESITRMLQTNHRLYILTVVSDDRPSDAVVKRFFDSFELTK